jgi:hypothetical protein
MAIAVTTPGAKVGFIDNATSADASGCEVIHAAVAGKKIKIRHLTINSTDAISITIGAGKTGAGVTAAVLGPIAFAALETMQWNFHPPLEIPTATLLSVDAGAGQICIFVQGVIE